MDGETANLLPETFWADYRAAFARGRVPARAAECYLKRAKHFVWGRDLGALQALVPGELSAYFRQVFSRSALEEWQIAQMVDAVRVLCDEMLHLSWCADFPWDEWNQPQLRRPEVSADQAREAAPSVPTDAVPTSVFADGFDGQKAFGRVHPSDACPQTHERRRSQPTRLPAGCARAQDEDRARFRALSLALPSSGAPLFDPEFSRDRSYTRNFTAASARLTIAAGVMPRYSTARPARTVARAVAPEERRLSMGSAPSAGSLKYITTITLR